jgi:hypothetical protein
VHRDSGIASLTQPLLAKHQMLRPLLTDPLQPAPELLTFVAINLAPPTYRRRLTRRRHTSIAAAYKYPPKNFIVK